MKKNSIRIFFLLALLVGQLSATAQTGSIKQVPQLLGKNAIVREWDNGWSVAFAQDLSGDGCFVLLDPALNTARTASLPSHVLVTDFRVHDDSVFCIGTLQLGGIDRALVGFFDIQQLFYGGGGIHYGQFYNGNHPDYSLITIPRRMDVYEHDGITHIAFVGDCELDPFTGFVPRTTVCDIYYDGIAWQCNYYFNKPGNEVYTDIVASDSYVAAVARDTNNTKCYVDVYYPSGDFPTTPLLTGGIFTLMGEPPVGAIRVEELSPDVFALAYQYKNSTYAGSTMMRFKVDNTIPTLNILGSYTTPHGPSSIYNTSWESKQLRYDAPSSKLMFLQKTSSSVLPTLEYIQCLYDISALGTGVEDFLYYPGYAWHRMDLLSTASYQKTGEDLGGLLVVENNDFNHIDCMTLNTLNFSPSPVTVTTERKDEYEDPDPVITYGYHIPTIQLHPFVLICD